MAYLHHRHSFNADQAPPCGYPHPQMPYAIYQPQPAPVEHYYPHYPPAEHADFGYHGFLPEEYDECGEISTRPRLTKEQAEVLEGQFQAHPKPNSMVKRNLAMQTKLSLPRVANWFQNRRAKAKQQRKQEEFENSQALGSSQGWRSDDNLSTRRDEKEQPAGQADGNSSSFAGAQVNTFNERPSSSEPNSAVDDDNKEAGWASLQRALTAARAQTQTETTMMPPPSAPALINQPSIASTHEQEVPAEQTQHYWPQMSEPAETWASLSAPEHVPFDFGFGESHAKASSSTIGDLSFESGPQMANPLIASTHAWREPLQTPTFPQQMSEHMGVASSPAFAIQNYSDSRRGSTSEQLATTFETFDLVGTPPTRPPMPSIPSGDSIRRVEGEIDIAARRKRPRPAPLGPAAIRSRSYGALTSMSPTMRSTSAMSSPLALRHVKSTGHSLNARFARVRKPSSAQRSPLNISTFAEAESFNSLMAQQNFAAFTPSTTGPEAATPVTHQHFETAASLPMPAMDVAAQNPEHSTHMPFHTTMQQLHPTMTSPPTTPFTTEFYLPANSSSYMMPPVSAPPQYATFPDYTPPYSAGPLTSSSWSDAPLPSPDYPNFPHVAQVPSVTFLAHPSQESHYHFPGILMPSEHRYAQSPLMQPEENKTEFHIQEFPGQREEHALVAQQLAQNNKPKSYVFNNQTQNDFGSTPNNQPEY